MKKIISLLLILCFVFSLTAMAKKNDLPLASVVFEANEPDADGFFTATLTVKNATFMGMQGVLYYNKEAVVPVSFETKEETADFKDAVRIATKATSLEDGKEIDWLSELWTTIHKEEGYITFANYTSVAQEAPNSLLNEERRIIADENGITIYEFSFRKISDMDACFNLYADDDKTPGVMLSNAQNNDPDVEVTVIQPDLVSKIKTEKSLYEFKPTVIISDQSETSPLTIEQRKIVRANGSVFLNIDNYAAVTDGTLVWVDKDNKSVVPYIKNDRTMVPLRFIGESLGAEVGYITETKTVEITYNDSKLTMNIGDKFFMLDGEKYEMDTECEIVNDRTFVPLRAVAEAFDKSVTWLATDRIVCVNPINYPWAEENKIEKELLSELKLMMTMLRDYAYALQ